MTFESRSRKALWFPPYSPCGFTLSGSWLPRCEDTHTALWSGPCEEELRPAANSQVSSVQFSSVTQSCLTLCNPMDCSVPGFPVHHQLPELAQTHVHSICDAIQPSHPLSSPSETATDSLESLRKPNKQWLFFFQGGDFLYIAMV